MKNILKKYSQMSAIELSLFEDITEEFELACKWISCENGIDAYEVYYENNTYIINVEHDNFGKFEGLITLKDASILFDKAESTLKTNIKNDKFRENKDCKKFGTTWVFDIKALEREYGKIN